MSLFVYKKYWQFFLKYFPNKILRVASMDFLIYLFCLFYGVFYIEF
ncbi:putative membrane protein [Bacteroides fragilis str. 1009-4-F |nr:putative membrane protein [Bacteroides fragilis str. 3-F-2 \